MHEKNKIIFFCRSKQPRHHQKSAFPVLKNRFPIFRPTVEIEKKDETVSPSLGIFEPFGKICGILLTGSIWSRWFGIARPSDTGAGGSRERNAMVKALKTSAEGRVCKFPSCHQLLSIYNHQTYCRVHLQKTLAEENPKPHKHI